MPNGPDINAFVNKELYYLKNPQTLDLLIIYLVTKVTNDLKNGE